MNPSNTLIEKLQEIASAEHAAAARLREKSRTKRRNLREKRANIAKRVKEAKAAVGSNDFIASEKGFLKKNRFPPHFKILINNTRRHIYSMRYYVDRHGYRRSISDSGRRRLFHVLLVLLTNCDFLSGQIGKITAKYMDTITHDSYMFEYSKRFGETISSSTWYRYIDILKSMNIFTCQSIKKYIKTGEGDTIVLSEPSYKWLSKAFLKSIGAFSDECMKTIKESYQKAINNGLCFIYRVHNAPDDTCHHKDLFSSRENATEPPFL